MIAFSKNINKLWVKLIIEELIRLGCVRFCLSPGLRSAPIVLMVSSNKNIKKIVHFDERSLAFFSLGISKSFQEIAPIIVTSGSAVANLLPAIMEAYYSNIPMIFLTADRPDYLRNSSSNQTIDQVNAFQRYLSCFINLPSPSDKIRFRFILSSINYAFYMATKGRPGPVQVNCPLNEPLISFRGYFSKRCMIGLNKWKNNFFSFTRYYKDLYRYSIKNIITRLYKSKKGVIIIGEIIKIEDEEAILFLLKKLQWPVYFDIASFRKSYFIQRVFNVIDLVEADFILQFGGRVFSKSLVIFLSKRLGRDYIIVDENIKLFDSRHISTKRYIQKVFNFCNSLLSFIKKEIKSSLFITENKKIQKNNRLTEDFIINQVCFNSFGNRVLFLSNSMPIRHMGLASFKKYNFLAVGTNRGVSGIDGIIATACGFFSAYNNNGILIVGDLAFLYDINSLSFIHNLKKTIIIILLNNKGGGIFRKLPIFKEKNFSPYIESPHDYSFSYLSSAFNLNHFLIFSRKHFLNLYQTFLEQDNSVILECYI